MTHSELQNFRRDVQRGKREGPYNRLAEVCYSVDAVHVEQHSVLTHHPLEVRVERLSRDAELRFCSHPVGEHASGGIAVKSIGSRGERPQKIELDVEGRDDEGENSSGRVGRY